MISKTLDILDFRVSADSKTNHFFPLAQWMRIGGLGGDWGFALWGFALWSFLHFHFISHFLNLRYMPQTFSSLMEVTKISRQSTVTCTCTCTVTISIFFGTVLASCNGREFTCKPTFLVILGILIPRFTYRDYPTISGRHR